ncbi:hypothetical protein N0V82_010224 [Gnomoniopsis sp. IMI 355080]|nr:hypothetical protein N0V82_010224 [Gnomoniopsis sp. IMI 355080]
MASLVNTTFDAVEAQLGNYLQTTPHKPVAYVVTALLLVFVAYFMQGSGRTKLPCYNPKKPFELGTWRVRIEFMEKGIEMMVAARKKYGLQPYRMHTDIGEVIMLPGERVQELRNHPALEFMDAANDDAHGYLPGFEPFHIDERTVRVVNNYLTKALNKLTVPLSNEAATALRYLLTDSPEWHEVSALSTIARTVSRMSTRIFIGEEMCSNDEWVNSVAEYSRSAFACIPELQMWPAFTRRIVHWFLPSAKLVRKNLEPCRKILQPVVAQRKKLKAEALARGEPAPVYDDALGWFEKEYGNNYDPAYSQITLSTVAIDTTSDLLQSTMLQLARHPEYIQPIRDEIVEVLGKQGLKKIALYNLKFMDSCLKETQRLKPILFGMRRGVVADAKLSDGFVIRKGERVILDSTNMWNAKYYDNPEKFDPYRFMRWREEGNENIAHLVSTSDKHMGFGHGQHACPGRFFAANELKLALCHLVLKYEWKLPEGHNPQHLCLGSSMAANPSLRLLIRRRKEELDMASLSD